MIYNAEFSRSYAFILQLTITGAQFSLDLPFSLPYLIIAQSPQGLVTGNPIPNHYFALLVGRLWRG